ncbi:hypothetical protein Pelo_9774 [Pelomyxa schiedti]|nr:hypothetical protein Pelo_9774 [Pelomyxa schiedti]
MVNFFYLSASAREGASWYNDNHVVKMGLEAVQVMWTCVRFVLEDADDIIAKFELETGKKSMNALHHAKHPVVMWCCCSHANFSLLLEYAIAIFEEYTARFHKVHVRQLDAEFFARNHKLFVFNNPKYTAWHSASMKWVLSGKSTTIKPTWWSTCGIPSGTNPDTCGATPPPQCVLPQDMVEGDTIQAYKNCYVSKSSTMAKMRYYHSEPPSWLPQPLRESLIKDRIQFQTKSGKKSKSTTSSSTAASTTTTTPSKKPTKRTKKPAKPVKSNTTTKSHHSSSSSDGDSSDSNSGSSASESDKTTGSSSESDSDDVILPVKTPSKSKSKSKATPKRPKKSG